MDGQSIEHPAAEATGSLVLSASPAPSLTSGLMELAPACWRGVSGAGDAARSASDERAYIANTDLVRRIRTGAPLAEAPQEYWYGGDETGYSGRPAMQRTAP